MAPTLTQIDLAREDAGLRARIMLAAAVAGKNLGSAELKYAQILAVDTVDDGGLPITIAGAYDYHWGTAFDALSAGNPPTRKEMQQVLERVGTDPGKITDGTIQRAVNAVQLN